MRSCATTSTMDHIQGELRVRWTRGCNPPWGASHGLMGSAGGWQHKGLPPPSLGKSPS
jgi:hypothetical protein